MNTMRHRIASLALAVSGLACAFTATAATYAINVIDYRDPVTGAVAARTALWGNNNNGEVIGVATYDPTGATGQFSFVYDPASGTFARIAPPAGVDPSLAQAISINDSGDITGALFTASGGEQGFILRGGVYSYFSYPGWEATSGRTIGNPSAAHPQGLVVGFSYNQDPVTGDLVSSAGFIYDPIANTFAAIPAATSPLTIAQGLNIAGQAVGSVRNTTPGVPRHSGFLYTPSSSDPMLGGTVATFNINGFRTRARGINDHGILVAAVNDVPGSLATRVYVGTSLGYQLVDIPSAVGPMCTDGDEPRAFPEGLNNSGQITGILTENQSGTCVQRGFIATPAYMPTGTTPSGAYTFSVDVVPNTPYFLDPAVAIGYDFKIGKNDPRFTTVRLPLGIGNNKYVLVVGRKAYDLNAWQLFDFRAHGHAKGVTGFRVACIDPAAALDPVNSLAFPTEVTFAGAGKFTGTQQPLTTIMFHGEDLAKLSQAECRDQLLNSGDIDNDDNDNNGGD